MNNHNTNFKKEEIEDFSKKTETFPIPSYWRERALRIFKEEVADLDMIEQLPALLERWNYWKKPSKSLFEAINILNVYEAGTCDLLAGWYYTDQDNFNENEISALAARLRFNFKRLALTEIIDFERITKNDLPDGRWEATFWLSPFRSKKSYRAAKNLYVKGMGKVVVTKKMKEKKKKKKKPSEGNRFNLLQMYNGDINTARRESGNFIFTSCPNNCPESYLRYPKIDYEPYIKEDGRIPILECKNCKKELVAVTPENYITKRFEQTYKCKIADLMKEFEV